MGLVKYRVLIDQDSCIGDGICISICPEVFEFNDEGKARITEKYRESDQEAVGVVDADKELEDSLVQAESMCPTQAIKLFKLE